jgi:hypothetical protein
MVVLIERAARWIDYRAITGRRDPWFVARVRPRRFMCGQAIVGLRGDAGRPLVLASHSSVDSYRSLDEGGAGCSMGECSQSPIIPQ